MSFINLLLEHTKFYESPTSFWRWAGYTAIAGILRDNCYRRLGGSKTYPNIYTLLLADSAVHRKGKPVGLCEFLVKSIRNTKIIAGRSSIQGILDELSRGETDKTTGKLLSGGSAYISAPEMSAGIVNDPEAIKILTDIYDFKDEYTSRLRGSGIFRIKNVCLTMLAASNEELLRDVYDTKAMYGGLLGRTFLVKPDEFRAGNSLLRMQVGVDNIEKMLEYLQKISEVKGEFRFTHDAEITYDDWYIPFRKSYERKSDKSGIIGRIHTSILKIAMIICIDRTLALEVTDDHMREAIQHCVKLIPNYSGFIMSSGKSTVADVASVLIEDIWQSPKKSITKQEFLQRHFYEFDVEVFDRCVLTLCDAGLLDYKQVIANSTEFSYLVTAKCKETFKLKEDEDA